MQLGQEIYEYNGDSASLSFSPDIAYHIWQNYYVPYLNGCLAKSGRLVRTMQKRD